MKALILLILAITIFASDHFGILNAPKGILEKTFNIPGVVRQQDTELVKLKEEKISLMSVIRNQRELELENDALRIQLGAPKRTTRKLLPARVLAGNTSFLVIDKGTLDGVLLNQTVIYKNVLVGQVSAVSTNRAKITLSTNQNIKIPAKTNKAQGIVQGMVLDNVTISEILEEKDLVFTSPSGSEEGILPDFLIGEVEKVIKNESALFQLAQIKSPVDFAKLEYVFIVL